MAPRQKTIFFLLRLSLGLGGLTAVFFLSRAKLPEIGRTLAGASPGWLALAFSLHALGLLLSAWRWQILARAQGDRIPLGFLAKSYIVGKFFNTFLPSSFGGDVVRIWDGSRYSTSVAKSSAIVIVERMTGILVLFIFALGASAARPDLARRVPVLGLTLLLGLAGLLAGAAFFLPPVSRLLRKGPEHGPIRGGLDRIALFRAVILDYRKQPRAFALATIGAVLLQLNVVIDYVLIGQALRLPIPGFDYLVFIPLILLLQIVPVTINGLGVREAAYVAVFAYYGLSSSAALSYAFIEIAFGLLVGALGAAIYITRR